MHILVLKLVIRTIVMSTVVDEMLIPTHVHNYTDLVTLCSSVVQLLVGPAHALRASADI